MRLTKNIYIVFIITLVLVCAIFFIDFIKSPDLPTKITTHDYIIYSIKSIDDGKFDKTIAYETNYKKLGLNDTQQQSLQETLKEKLLSIKEQEKSAYVEKFANDGNFNPDQEIEFITIDENNLVGYTVRFSSLETFNYFYGGFKRETKNGAFVDKLIQKGNYPMSNNDEQILKNTFIETVDTLVGIDVTEKYDPIIYYEYVALSANGQTNAHQVSTDSNGYTHYIWIGNRFDKSNDTIIQFNTVNYWLWILLALALPLVGMSIAIIVAVVNDKKHKENHL